MFTFSSYVPTKKIENYYFKLVSGKNIIMVWLVFYYVIWYIFDNFYFQKICWSNICQLFNLNVLPDIQILNRLYPWLAKKSLAEAKTRNFRLLRINYCITIKVPCYMSVFDLANLEDIFWPRNTLMPPSSYQLISLLICIKNRFIYNSSSNST